MKPIKLLRTLITLLSKNTLRCSRSSSNVIYYPISLENLERISWEESTNRQSCLTSSFTLYILKPCSAESALSPSFEYVKFEL